MEPEPATVTTNVQEEVDKDVLRNPHCTNCDASLAGQFCSVCGQDSTETVVPLKTFFKQGFEDVLSFDFRYPRTLKALFFPGRLTSQYLKGQRVSFVNPLKFAFNASILLFATIALFAPEQAQVTVNSDLAADLGSFTREFALWLTFGQLLVLPVWAGIIYYGFRKQKPLYLSHLIFALHFHTAVSVAFIINTLFLALLPIQIAGWFILAIMAWIYGPYLILSLRQVYAATWKKTILYGLFALLSYMGLLVMVSTIVAAAALGANLSEG